jgi:isopentenyldiphosphate isomerase
MSYPEPPAGEGASTAGMTDPHEPLEVYDAAGQPTGRAKARGAVHLDGDWHLAFFCWIVRAGPDGPELVLQKRSPRKDVWPGRFDASSAGHVRFGETRAEMLRELDEELGLVVAESELVRLPRHSQEHAHPNGIVDREHHELNLLRCDLPFEAYRPSPVEVSGLAAVPALALAELTEGRRGSIETELVEFDSDSDLRRSPCLLRRDDLVPYDGHYHRRLAEVALRLCEAG